MISKSQIDKLGDRLRKGTPRDGDDEMLQAFLSEHDVALEHLVDELRSLRLPDGRTLEPTSRVKTIDTLVEKLQREPLGLSTIRDIAGARVTVGESLLEQDSVRDSIVQRFNATKVVDRRVDPRSGYRAVHVIVKYESCWAEIQLRTRLQHHWANAFEHVADRIGREIRYGQMPLVGTMEEKVVLGLLAGSHLLKSLEDSEVSLEVDRRDFLDRLAIRQREGADMTGLQLERAAFDREYGLRSGQIERNKAEWLEHLRAYMAE